MLYAVRLKPGDDLKQSISKLVNENKLSAGFVASAVGSLEKLCLRLAGATAANQPAMNREGDFEIVALTGAVGIDSMHLHMAVSDESGAVIGGHLKDGCIVRTTVELLFQGDESLYFSREDDETTGFDELVIRKSKEDKKVSEFTA
jgi:predicted DNA-binding protein with PD1-like motif